jgi:hypothetical protein
MSKKATIGISPKDSSMDKMDRYIKRNEAREKARFRRHGNNTKKPFEEWSLQAKVDHYENMSPSQKFDRKYPKYYTWFEAVRKEMEEFVYPAFFMDCVNQIKPEMQKLFEDKTSIKETVNTLKTVHKIY